MLKDTQIASVCLHPGVIKSEIYRNVEAQSGLMTKIQLYAVRLFAKDCKEGAKCSIYCATDDDIPNKSGLYFK